jgi:hypothetical protein
MKDQASLNLLIVDSPIDSKALTGHLMLRATSSGLKVYDATGSATELAGGGISEITVGEGLSGAGTASSPLNLNIANYTSQSTISLSSTQGSVNLVGYNSVNLQETFGNKLTLAERGIVITTASGADVLLNEHASNSPSGFVILDNTGKLPAVDGSQLTNLPAATVDLTNYAGGGVRMDLTTDFEVYCGEIKLDASGNLYLTAYDLFYNGAASNTPNGLVLLDDNGKIPSSLYDAGTGGDTSALETRVTTLETTVGTLNTTVDEILADYGEGSGALVYRVVASATEPVNPTEGMIWIQTE